MEGGGELAVSLALDASGDAGFDAAAYMGALRARRFGRWMRWSPRMASTHDLVTQNFAKLPMGVVCATDMQFKGRVNSSYYNSLSRGVSRGSGRTVGVIHEHRRADLWGSNMQTWMEDGRPSSSCLSCPPAR
ncbi:biotin--protein ligase 1, chloroplastic-like isoform X2 [Aegilops tauschii subsp. strangulata]|uniref:biotin--protein ligase 1, chloroplastic-like isoform X2 n=1 Tax=Aegilops tauschii subsp. strangulata TaxID=200361 RepID=UPI003CC85434